MHINSSAIFTEFCQEPMAMAELCLDTHFCWPVESMKSHDFSYEYQELSMTSDRIRLGNRRRGRYRPH